MSRIIRVTARHPPARRFFPSVHGPLITAWALLSVPAGLSAFLMLVTAGNSVTLRQAGYSGGAPGWAVAIAALNVLALITAVVAAIRAARATLRADATRWTGWSISCLALATLPLILNVVLMAGQGLD